MDSTASHSLRALIVEDSADDALLLIEALREGGFALDYEVVDSRVALQTHLRGGAWDVVLCDHNLPDFNAPHALEIVRNHDADLPFIIISGSIPESLASEQMLKGASDFIAKGNLARLVPALKRELREAATRRELNRVQGVLEHSRFHDGQTGLANIELLRSEMQQRVQQERPFLLALVEVGQLRPMLNAADPEWNRSFLAKLGKRISILNENALAARLGDDAFALLVERDGTTDGERVAQRILQEMGLPMQVVGRVLYFPSHVGISRFPESGRTVGNLIDHAGMALRWAKERGSGYAMYDADLDSEREARIDMERALSAALYQEEFVLHYQPQFELAGGRLVGVEALLRWDRPGHGLVSPASFIPLLEESRLIVPVGEWVMKTACEASRRWQQVGLPAIRTAVNLSAIQFRQGGLLDMVDRTLAQTGLEPGALELEITESIAMYNEQEIMGTLSALKARGVLLAIDDFGTGYSSLGYLKRFPIHRLKIDRTFVREVVQDSGDAAIVKAILAMAASLKLEVIAEGVETAEQAEFLKANGCQEVQGYYFGRPMPEARLMEILRAHDD